MCDKRRPEPACAELVEASKGDKWRFRFLAIHESATICKIRWIRVLLLTKMNTNWAD